jgi:hypothetical protein
MSKTKLATVSLTAAASLLSLALSAGTGYAFGWGAEDQENYQFNPQHRDEILRYGSQIGANWSQEIKDSAYASKQPVNAGEPEVRANATQGQNFQNANN